MVRKYTLGHLELFWGLRSGLMEIAFDSQSHKQPQDVRPISAKKLKQYEQESMRYWGALIQLLGCFTKKESTENIVLGSIRSRHEIRGNTSHVQIERSIEGAPKFIGDWDHIWVFTSIEEDWEWERRFSDGYFDLSFLPFDGLNENTTRIGTVRRKLCKLKMSIELAMAKFVGLYLENSLPSLSLQDPVWEETLSPHGFNGFEFRGIMVDEYESALNNTDAKTHDNILLLTKRMDSTLDAEDYSGVVHASASIFETMAKDVIGIATIQDQTLKSFFARYRLDSRLPPEILNYMLAVYETRNTTPLAGHGSTKAPTLGKESAIALCELTKAIVRIQYKLRGSVYRKAT